MTLLDDRPTAASPESPNGLTVSPEALFKEARQRRRHRWGVGAGSVVVLVVALCVVVISGEMGGSSGRASEANTTGPGSPLLSRAPGSFQTVGNGILTNALDCISKSTCFAVVYPQPGDALHDGRTFPGVLVAKTADGGASWMRLRSFPRRWSPQPVMACPTAEMCALAVQPTTPHNNQLPAQAMAITRDGGSTWAVRQLPLPALGEATVKRVTCTDGLHCLVYVGEHDSPRVSDFVLSTSDGGSSWEMGGVLPVPAAMSVVALRCGPDDQCIALAMGLSGGVTLTSDDFGANWIQNPQSPFRPTSVMNASCGDASQCVYSTVGGGLALTQNGAGSWALAPVPTPIDQVITGVDCVNEKACFAAAAQWRGANYTNPIIYRSTDGGQIWSTLKVPQKAEGSLISTVTPISCPNSVGCIGVSQMTSPAPHAGTKRVVISSF